MSLWLLAPLALPSLVLSPLDFFRSFFFFTGSGPDTDPDTDGAGRFEDVTPESGEALATEAVATEVGKSLGEGLLGGAVATVEVDEVAISSGRREALRRWT